MAVISVTNGIYSGSRETVEKLSRELGFKVYSDDEIIRLTAEKYDMKVETIKRAVQGQQIVFNNFTHEKEKSITYLKCVLAEKVAEGDCIFHGFTSHLIPETVTHVMKVLIIADKVSRVRNAETIYALESKDALRKINRADEGVYHLVDYIHGKRGWDESLYDIVIPSYKYTPEESVELIVENLKTISEISKDKVESEAEDFSLAAKVETVLVDFDEKLAVTAKNGDVVININKNILMLARFKQKIANAAKNIPGVKSVETKIGKDFYKADIMRNYEFNVSPKVLLVDDERDLVETLSERLQLRDINTHVVYDGKKAIEFSDREDTDVMVLDLKMPGINGIEVLKQIKETKPEIEVIILTGHGTEEDRQKCMELGAFAYLKKPADIDLLTRTMKEAYEKINRNKEAISA